MNIKCFATAVLLSAFLSFPLFAGIFEDIALEAAVREHLSLTAEEELTIESLLLLETLTARSAGIQSLSGIQHAVNLTELDLRDNRISDISPLDDLVNLTWVSLRENIGITDTSPLRNLTSLQYLNINQNSNITSIEPLSGMKSLDTLLMRSVKVLHNTSEQEVLLTLPSLERLNIRDTGLRSVSVILPVLQKDSLIELDIQDNPIRDIYLLEFIPSDPSLSGRFRINAGAMLGIEPLVLSALYDFDMRLTLEYQPYAVLKVLAALDTDFSSSRQDFSRPEVDQLFVQWKASPSLMLSLGKQKQDWGHDLLFETNGDFADDLDDGFSLYGTYGDISGYIATVRDSFLFQDFAYALRYHHKGDIFHGSVQVRYLHGSIRPLWTSLFGSVSFFDKLTLRMQNTSLWDVSNFPMGSSTFSAGARYKCSWDITGEYLLEDMERHFLGASITSPPLFGITPKLEARHLITDPSGFVELSMKKEVFEHFTFTVSVPIIYGSYYLMNSPIPGDSYAALIADMALRIRF